MKPTNPSADSASKILVLCQIYLFCIFFIHLMLQHIREDADSLVKIGQFELKKWSREDLWKYISSLCSDNVQRTTI